MDLRRLIRTFWEALLGVLMFGGGYVAVVGAATVWWAGAVAGGGTAGVAVVLARRHSGMAPARDRWVRRPSLGRRLRRRRLERGFSEMFLGVFLLTAGIAVVWGVTNAAGAHARPGAERALAARVDGRGGYYLDAEDLARIKENVTRYGWAREAWTNTKQFADSRLGAVPHPANPNLDYSRDEPAEPNWRDDLYAPGFVDGNNAIGLAVAYRVSGDPRYAIAANRILTAWVAVYNHPPGHGGGVVPGHNVAEPMGPMIKLFMTADLLWPFINRHERAQVAAWARRWVAPAEFTADDDRDHPWIPDATYNGLRTNAASYGNSPLGQRAMAMWAAAIAGPAELRSALAWNWSHRTRAGAEYGWDDVLGHMLIPGTGGETVEGRERQDLGYGLFGWSELLLIADLAKHAGYSRDLFVAGPSPDVNLLAVAPFYTPLLAGDKRPSYPAEAQLSADDYAAEQSRLRSAAETAYANCPVGNPNCRLFQRALDAAGDAARGDSYDPFVKHWNALTGAP